MALVQHVVPQPRAALPLGRNRMPHAGTDMHTCPLPARLGRMAHSPPLLPGQRGLCPLLFPPPPPSSNNTTRAHTCARTNLHTLSEVGKTYTHSFRVAISTPQPVRLATRLHPRRHGTHEQFLASHARSKASSKAFMESYRNHREARSNLVVQASSAAQQRGGPGLGRAGKG